MWAFHDTGDVFGVESVLTLTYYALDLHTKEVKFERGWPRGSELRVYGPDGQIVFYVIPDFFPKETHRLFWGLVKELDKLGKITPI
jgi:hypothetical protein